MDVNMDCCWVWRRSEILIIITICYCLWIPGTTCATATTIPDKSIDAIATTKTTKTTTSCSTTSVSNDGDTTTSSTSTILPNFIIFFADNLGYNDISYFGAPTAQTPYIDNLIGKQGMRLNHWNSVAHLCSASRATLLTGQYPIRTGIYPGVFEPDSANGLLYNHSRTIARILKEQYPMYRTSIVGKWHLGHSSDEYLPTVHHGFDEWMGIPYHMSGGSIHDEHICVSDVNKTMWLPLYKNTEIIEQPVLVDKLVDRYKDAAKRFIQQSIDANRPFLLYMSFSHVHQLCATKKKKTSSDDDTNNRYCQWSSKSMDNSSFIDAVQEMDSIVGYILNETDTNDTIKNNTLVLFTSDNGPWIAEQQCSGSKGPFEGRWLRDNVPLNCTACPHDYIPNPTTDRRRRCTLIQPPKDVADNNRNADVVRSNKEIIQNNLEGGSDHDQTSRTLSLSFSKSASMESFGGINFSHNDDEESYSIDGIHCGEDTGLGSIWEGNLRMPALIRWTSRIKAGAISNALVSTLDVVPTFLSIIEESIQQQQKEQQKYSESSDDKMTNIIKTDNVIDEENKSQFDGIDISDILFGTEEDSTGTPPNRQLNDTDFEQRRKLFFWRDGFLDGPLGPPYGRYDVVAVKIEPYYKFWFYTKSAHLNADAHVFHDPPLIFNTDIDPAEAFPVNIDGNIYLQNLVDYVKYAITEHKNSVNWTFPLTLERDPKHIPCVNKETGCRTTHVNHPDYNDDNVVTTVIAD